MQKLTSLLLLVALLAACAGSQKAVDSADISSEIAVVQLPEDATSVYRENLLQSGPMTGYSAMREVGIWAQTTEAAEVQIRYRVEGETNFKLSEPQKTHGVSAYTAQIAIGNLEPGQDYEYEILINGAVVRRPYPLRFKTQTLWQYRTDPPDFKFIIGSCAYVNEQDYERPGRLYGADYKIFSHMAEEEADMMLWLGDNTYLREVDWDSRSGIYHRYTHTRSLEELQPLLGAMHHQAIWDDHDYGPNDSDASYAGKEWALEAFKNFWMNPNYNAAGEGGISGFFSWQDCDFFLLDNRWVRSDARPDGQILGAKQLDWLRLALKKSRAPFKFICTGGQTLSDAAIYENHARYPVERQALIDMIKEENIHGVVFLNGDRHSSEVTRFVNDAEVGLYEITSSPLTSGAYDHTEEPNTLRLSGSMIGERNYAVLEVSGKRKERSCTVTFKNVDGQVLYKHDLKTWKWKPKK